MPRLRPTLLCAGTTQDRSSSPPRKTPDTYVREGRVERSLIFPLLSSQATVGVKEWGSRPSLLPTTRTLPVRNGNCQPHCANKFLGAHAVKVSNPARQVLEARPYAGTPRMLDGVLLRSDGSYARFTGPPVFLLPCQNWLDQCFADSKPLTGSTIAGRSPVIVAS